MKASGSGDFRLKGYILFVLFVLRSQEATAIPRMVNRC
jgi:hypothetical protein